MPFFPPFFPFLINIHPKTVALLSSDSELTERNVAFLFLQKLWWRLEEYHSSFIWNMTLT